MFDWVQIRRHIWPLNHFHPVLLQKSNRSDETKINIFGSDGVKRVWWQPGEEYKNKCVLSTVKHGGGSVMVWGVMSAADMYCDILKQSMIPSLRRLGRRAVFQHDNNHCLAREAEGKGVSRPKAY